MGRVKEEREGVGCVCVWGCGVWGVCACVRVCVCVRGGGGPAKGYTFTHHY